MRETSQPRQPVGLPDRYVPVQPIGEGGQGSVYLVVDLERDGRLLALKAVTLQREASGRGERLADEFLMLSRLVHPSIARVRDFGALEGGRGVYYTADYVAGRSILEWYAEARDPARREQIVSVAAQALAALRFLERKKVAHGDIKPQNLLVEAAEGEPPRLRLVDFGSSRLRDVSGASRPVTAVYAPPPGGPRSRGPDPDLYGLGLTLFHVLVGRLPFSLAEEGSLEDWRRDGAVAIPSQWMGDVDEALDLLIRRLTALSSEERFRDAREALEFLSRRAGVEDALSVRGVAGFHGREALIDETLSTGERGASGVTLVAGAPGSGKSRFLDVLRMRIQAGGSPVVFYASPSDPAGATELMRLAGLSGRFPGPAAEVPRQALEVAFRLRETVFLLVDDADVSSYPPLLEELIRLALEGPRSGRRLVAVLASSFPDSVARLLALPLRRFRRLTLPPLARADLEAVAADFFDVEHVPRRLVELLERSSGGLPAHISFALDELASRGICADLEGRLLLPRRLPERIRCAGERGGKEAFERLPARLREPLALLELHGVALSPEEAASLHPGRSVRTWRMLMEELVWRGALRRVGSGRGARFGVVAGLEAVQWSGRLHGEREAEALQDSLRLLERMKRNGGLSCELALCLSRHLARVGREVEAARVALAARRLLVRQGRVDEAGGAMARAFEGGKRQPVERAFLLARLRFAESCLQLGRVEDGLGALELPGGHGPGWFERAALERRALLLESRGEPEEAIAALERLRARSSSRYPGSASDDPGRHEIDARLARLYFQAGRSREGREALETGRALLDRLAQGMSLPALERGVRILGTFAAAEIYHGERRWAERHLGWALDAARAGRRPDLELPLLNQLAVLLAGEERVGEALDVFRRVEVLARERGDRPGELRAVLNRAHGTLRLENLEEAEDLYRRACRLSDDLGRHAFTAAAWIGLASVVRERGRLIEALRLYRRVLHLGTLARVNDRLLAQNNLGELYLVLGRPERSLEARRRAVEDAEGLGNAFLLGLSLRGLGSTLWSLGREAEAEEMLGRSIAIEEGSSDPRHVGGAHYFLGRIAAVRGDWRRALASYRRAGDLSRRRGERAYAEASALAMASLLLARGRRRMARRLLERARGAAAGGPRRWSLLAATLSLRVESRWADQPGPFWRALDAAEARGEVWTAFLAVEDALHDPSVPPGLKGQLRLRRRLQTDRLVRRLAADDAEAFRRYWLRDEPRPEESRALREESVGNADGARANEAVSSSAGPPCLLHVLFGEEAKGSSRAVEDVLERLRQELSGAAVWVIGRSGADIRAATGNRAGTLLEEGTAVVRMARGRSGVAEDAWGFALRAGEDAGAPILAMASPAAPRPARERARTAAALPAAAAVVRLVLELESTSGALRRERELHGRAREELRRLVASAMREKELLDTALITHRSDLVREAWESDERITEPPREPVAVSRPMKELLASLPRIAEADLPVLILGESGVGKDLIARRIHHLGRRRGGPFLAEICSLPETLLEDELFGHVSGAFTGAEEDRPGLFERAHGGTLYLDEISDLSPGTQARLLRVLETRRVRPLGASEERAVDFRMISSSRVTDTRDLLGGGLREDLFYRLHGQLLVVPPLRERPEDIAPLVHDYLSMRAAAHGRPPPLVPAESLEKLVAHSWPGNVRELRNELEKALLDEPGEILPDRLFRERAGAPSDLAPSRRHEKGLRAARDAFERALVLEALRQNGGNASQAARALRVTRRHLGKLLEKHRIDLTAFRGEG